MGETEEFNTLAFEKKLLQLKDTQESIQGLSSWCLKQKSHHKKIVSSWLNVLKRVKVEQRLTLFYLANDVIQYSKRKGYEFVDSWGLYLQKATPLVRDEKVRPKILRIFKIWEQRMVYDEEFLSDLTGLLSAGATKKTDDDPLDFQPQQLVNKIKQCKVLEGDTGAKLKTLLEHDLEMSDADELCSHLKDRSIKHDVIKELNEGISCVEKYTQALQREIVARETLLALLNSANQYYSTQRGEVKVVAYAYKNFGSRVRALKRKLDEMLPTLPSAAPSPPPRDEDVPSPGPDEDLELPGTENDNTDVSYDIDQTFNTSISADGSLYNLGLSSFLTSDNPLAMFNDTIDLDPTNESNIEVISTRGKQDIIDCMLKEVVTIDSTSPGNTSVGSVVSASLSQKSQDALPGLDLLTPDSTGIPPPPISFYGTMNSLNDEPEVYVPPVPVPVPAPVPSPWAAPLTSVPPAPPLAPVDPHATWIPPPSSARNVFAEPPASPPPGQRAPLAPPPLRPDRAKEAPPADVDQRGLLPPPPPPPPILPLLGQTEDVDHRLLPPTNVPPPGRHTGQQDIDHRNLISLTHQPPVQQTHNNVSMDQDYRVPPLAPTDIVESVDMDLSDDEEQGMYQESNRRNSFNNNKVLVGGDEINNMKRHDGSQSAPAQLNAPGPRFPPATPLSMAPPLMPPTVPRMASTAPRIATGPPPGTQNPPFQRDHPRDMHPPRDMHNPPRDMNNASRDMHSAPRDMPNARDVHNARDARDMHASHDMRDMHDAPPRGPHNEDGPLRGPPNTCLPPPSMPPAGPMACGQGPPGPRPRSAPVVPPLANPFDNMPPNLKFNMPNFQDQNYDEYDEYEGYDEYDERRGERERESPEYPEYDEEWTQGRPMNPRFPRNWSPRNNFRPNFSPQFRPRGGPRAPNRWNGPRGPRPFW